MNPTTEQTKIINYIKATDDLTLVDSVAGSGKTTLLVTIANTIPHTNGLYLAYNRSVAKEAQRKFPKSTHCMTTHSMAFHATVKPPSSKLTLGTFGYRDIKEKLNNDNKYQIVQHIRKFCLSKHLSFEEYADEVVLPTYYISIAKKYLDLMQNGKIECTHEFYLKLFHILLANKSLSYSPFDFIMLDEAGDLNEVTLEIFLLLPSKKKIAVGDKFQNIYQFNDTINCFKVLHGQGTSLRMTQSFRVAKPIAQKVEHFGQTYLDPTIEFKGITIKDKTIYSKAYLTRTNSALIQRMIHLNQQSLPYSLVRKASDIFRIPLMLCNLKYKGFITEPEYRPLQKDVDAWYDSSQLQEHYPSLLQYLSAIYDDDFQLSQAIRLLQNHGKSAIITAYSEARKHEKINQDYTLATVHSCKGAEFDEVEIANDLNRLTKKSVDYIDTYGIDNARPEDIENLNLYYVACTRAAKQLYNAVYL